MKRFILIGITCIVLDQKKVHKEWLTNCRGIDVNGQVVFDEKIQPGQMVMYRPFIKDGDEIMHGEIINISDPPTPNQDKITQSSDTGKLPE